MAAVEATEPDHAVRAVSLFAVLAAVKTVALAAARLPVASLWFPIACYWQDVLVALAGALVFRIVGRGLARILYAAVVAYVALNLPVMLVLSTPLTGRLLGAAGGALADSIARYATPLNLGLAVATLAAGAILPAVLKGRVSVGRRTLACAVAVILAGPVASARTDTRGLHRNAIGALASSFLPRVAAVPATEDWRASPFTAPAGDDLRELRGTAAGRNVIVMVLESTAAEYLSIYGAPRDPMPNLTALAARSVVFERMYAVYPESVKALLTTVCSRYPGFDTSAETYAGGTCDSVAERLREAGYRTGLFHSGRFDYLGMRTMIERRGFETLEDAAAIGGQVHSSFGVDEASAVRRMLGWIDGRPGQPFFLMYLPIAGHHPYAANVAGPFTGDRDFDQYLNALHESDAALGLLLDGLRARGIDRQTMLVVFADHGEAFQQHPGNIAHTMFVHEENVRVPFVLALPDGEGGGRRVRRVGSLVDVPPTILELTGLPSPSSYEGRSLLAPEPRLALFFTDYSLGWLGAADGCWKYLYQVESGRSLLYDVCADPRETADRAGQEPERVLRYRDRVRAWAAATKAAATSR